MTTRAKDGIYKPKVLLASKHTKVTDDIFEPSCYSQAKDDPNWRGAMDAEYHALQKNGTWSLVPSSPHMNLVGCKWVFRIKRKADGTIERYKARLVAKGFNQQEGIDFGETFSPVIKPCTIRVVLTLALSYSWPIHQLDIQNAFLNGFLMEEVYMKQPPGYIDSTFPNHVCKLHRSLYGLKQAPRAWYHRLSIFLQKLGFIISRCDTSLFIRRTADGVIYLLVYVDDIILTGSCMACLQALIDTLQQEFALKDLGPLSFFLGVEATRLPTGLFLSQRRYIEDLLRRANMHGAKPCSTPLSTSSDLNSQSGTLLTDPTYYRSIVGGLQYLLLTRPEIAFSVNKVCQFMHRPTTSHLLLVKRILRYLQNTTSYGILLQSVPSMKLDFTAYNDADWAGDSTDRRSTSGYCVFLGPNIISWSSRKQRTVSRSSTEAEYRGLAIATAELMWIENLLHELRAPIRTPPVLWCDNLSATYLTMNPVFSWTDKTH